MPTGRAVLVDGGYRLSGRWSFSSGCDHGHGVNLGAMAGVIDLGEAKVPDFRSFLLESGDPGKETAHHLRRRPHGRGTGFDHRVHDR